MRWLVVVALGLPGCDAVFQLERPPADAMLIDAPPVCPESFGTNRYLYVSDLRTWVAAEGACVALDMVAGDQTFTHLAVITDLAEISRLSAGLPADDEVWVGLTDRKVNDQFVWITDELPLTHPIPWGSTEPNSVSMIQCATIETRTSTLGDSGCDSTEHPFLCECDGYPEQPARIF